MRVFLDTNILIDVGAEREPFAKDSAAVLDWCGAHAQDSYIAWHSISNTYYILRQKPGSDSAARKFLDELLSWIKLAPTTIGLARNAVRSEGGDFEDKLQIECAVAAAASVIVTRNPGDFATSPISAISPSQFLKKVKAAAKK